MRSSWAGLIGSPSSSGRRSTVRVGGGTGADMGVVTFSAAYGAAAEVAPAVAERLGLPFHDRAIRPRSPAASGCRSPRRRRTTRPSSGACGGWSPRWGRCPTRWVGCCRRRPCPTPGPTAEQTEKVLGEICAAPGSGPRRAGALCSRPAGRLHARLDGPRERRLGPPSRGRAALSTKCAARWRRTTGPARPTSALHRRDPSAARHYHLVIDSTALPVETVVDLVVTAARARGIGLR